ncbi:probable fatty acyl-CoA reductase 5 isoform X3 [Capsella rubella]|uniref:probable fatty acyl-CoA reductase 5 isoform X3 n=1 Tax=Capsella rubella TaxID=81985 RepID=UPI000CD5213D|nr:probable fatty acyl-CoA reductase 5 isoform X3 [Capsella rubella]
MELNCVQFLENKTILVTGATGFLAKVFVEKILRVQPVADKLYLLVRASNDEAATKRLRTEVFEKDLFKVLRENLGDEKLNRLLYDKVVSVPGDIATDEQLGMNDSNLIERMQKEIDIVVNVAATTNFDERYDVGLEINAFGALNILNFAKKCVRAQLLLHVSTAYVCGEKPGFLPENLIFLEDIRNEDGLRLDINFERELMKERLKELKEQDCSEEDITLAMKELGMERAKLHGWPNTYVFTKSMGEMLLGNHKENLPLVIIRPTMITSTFSEPFPGWIEGLRTIDSVVVAFGKGRLKCFLANPNSVLDLIPVDMVANAMVTAATIHAGNLGSQTVYHVGSSFKNPITFEQVHDLAARYFTINPLVGRDGSPIIVSKGTIFSTMAQFSFYVTLRYKLPLQLLKLIDIIYPWRKGDKYGDKNRKIELAMRLVELYEPYVLFKGIFDDRNTKSLCANQKEEESKNSEKMMFDFDPKVINWGDYLTTIHIPGLITHVLKR